jgi:hypothetical protein
MAGHHYSSYTEIYALYKNKKYGYCGRRSEGACFNHVSQAGIRPGEKGRILDTIDLLSRHKQLEDRTQDRGSRTKSTC